MFRKIFVAAVFAVMPFVAFAQDPVTERPGSTTPQVQPKQANPQPQAAPVMPNVQAQAIKASGTIWQGVEAVNNNGKLIFALSKNGEALMIDANSQVKGSWMQKGNQIVIRFKNCVYEGTIQGRVLAGRGIFTEGANAGSTWKFSVGHVDPYRGREFSGQENLGGFGKVSFRFGENNTVTMIDARSQVRGSYTMDMDQITMHFGNCVYVGQITNANRITGIARYTEGDTTPWDFDVQVAK